MSPLNVAFSLLLVVLLQRDRSLAEGSLSVVNVTSYSAELRWALISGSQHDAALYNMESCDHQANCISQDIVTQQGQSDALVKVSGLTPCTRYHVTVDPILGLKTDLGTQTSITTLPDPLPQVTTRVTSVGNSSLTVAWDEPSNINNCLDHYRAILIPISLHSTKIDVVTRDSVKAVQDVGLKRTVTFTGLRPGQAYAVLVEMRLQPETEATTDGQDIHIENFEANILPEGVMFDDSCIKKVGMAYVKGAVSSVFKGTVSMIIGAVAGTALAPGVGTVVGATIGILTNAHLSGIVDSAFAFVEC